MDSKNVQEARRHLQVKGLKRWFSEKWKDQKGNECGSGKLKTVPKCRPSKRVTRETPRTWKELTPSQKKRAVADKNKATREGKQYGSVRFEKLRKRVK
jgi:hypothetical protein